ncbi:hypothetical protein HD554DRAFT_2330439 [Boletus coccyginus]|nr:hypothetical protein HD554DRAFT_2330439 [Boletus coccyginus]
MRREVAVKIVSASTARVRHCQPRSTGSVPPRAGQPLPLVATRVSQMQPQPRHRHHPPATSCGPHPQVNHCLPARAVMPQGGLTPHPTLCTHAPGDPHYIYIVDKKKLWYLLTMVPHPETRERIVGLNVLAAENVVIHERSMLVAQMQAANIRRHWQAAKWRRRLLSRSMQLGASAARPLLE